MHGQSSMGATYSLCLRPSVLPGPAHIPHAMQPSERGLCVLHAACRAGLAMHTECDREPVKGTWLYVAMQPDEFHIPSLQELQSRFQHNCRRQF